MTAREVTAPDDEQPSAEQPEPPPQESSENTRIAALLRDRFGIDR